MKVVLFLFALNIYRGGFIRYELYQRVDTLQIKKNASTLQFNVTMDGDKFTGYGAINFIFESDTLRIKPIEAYIRMRGDRFGFLLGKKIFSFGTAEFLNPTDFIAPRNYTEIYGDIEELKEGIRVLEFDLYFGNWAFRFIEEPQFTPTRFPLHSFSFAVPIRDSIYTFYFRPAEGVLYDSTKKVQTYTLRAEGYLSGFDLTFTFHYGFDRFPDIKYEYLSCGAINELELKPIHARYFMGGMDLSYAIGNREIHFEASYKRSQEDWNIPGIKFPELFAISGVKSTMNDGMTSITIEGGVKKVFGYREPRELSDPVEQIVEDFAQSFYFQKREYEYYGILTVSHKTRDEKLKIMMNSIYEFESGDYFILPRLTYSPEDGVNLSIGGLFIKKDGTTAFTQAGKHLGQLVYLDARFYY